MQNQTRLIQVQRIFVFLPGQLLKVRRRFFHEKNGKKIIPAQIWKEFFKFWDNTEYESLDAKSIKELLGKYMFVQLPKDVRNRKAIDEWFAQMKELREKGKPFGGKTISFKGDKTTLESLYGSEPVKPTELSKKIWVHIKEKDLVVKKVGNGKASSKKGEK